MFLHFGGSEGWYWILYKYYILPMIVFSYIKYHIIMFRLVQLRFRKLFYSSNLWKSILQLAFWSFNNCNIWQNSLLTLAKLLVWHFTLIKANPLTWLRCFTRISFESVINTKTFNVIFHSVLLLNSSVKACLLLLLKFQHKVCVYMRTTRTSGTRIWLIRVTHFAI